MTDDELLKILEEMRSMLGDLPNPEQEPKRFAYYVRLFNFYKERNG